MPLATKVRSYSRTRVRLIGTNDDCCVQEALGSVCSPAWTGCLCAPSVLLIWTGGLAVDSPAFLSAA